MLADHDIAETAARRQILGLLMQIDMLEARWDQALARAAQIRELQDKPADANKVDKPDIWKARDVALPAGKALAPVTIVVWDSGVDAPVFANQLAGAGGKETFIAFDRFSMPSASPLKVIPPELRARLPQLQSRSKGLSDLTSNIDSPEASEVRTLVHPARALAAVGYAP